MTKSSLDDQFLDLVYCLTKDDVLHAIIIAWRTSKGKIQKVIPCIPCTKSDKATFQSIQRFINNILPMQPVVKYLRIMSAPIKRHSVMTYDIVVKFGITIARR